MFDTASFPSDPSSANTFRSNPNSATSFLRSDPDFRRAARGGRDSPTTSELQLSGANSNMCNVSPGHAQPPQYHVYQQQQQQQQQYYQHHRVPSQTGSAQQEPSLALTSTSSTSSSLTPTHMQQQRRGDSSTPPAAAQFVLQAYPQVPVVLSQFPHGAIIATTAGQQLISQQHIHPVGGHVLMHGGSAVHATGSGGGNGRGSAVPPRYKYKPELCRNWEQSGTCNYRQCTFAHGIDELRQFNRNYAALDSGCDALIRSGVSPTSSNSSPPQSIHTAAASGAGAAQSGVAGTPVHGAVNGGGNHNNNNNNNGTTPTNGHGSNGNSAPGSPSSTASQVLANVERLLGELVSDVTREKEAFAKLTEQNRVLERELQALQAEHNKEKQNLTSLRERAAALRAQLEVVPLPSFMGKQA